MKKIVTLVALALAIIACKEATVDTKEVKEEVKAPAKPAVALYTFDGGSVGANNLNLFAQGDTYKGESKQLVDAFYVIKHPKGILLWDTGLPEGLVGQDPYTTPDGAFTISRKDSIINQLASIGVTKEDVDYIAFSHIHFDHTGAANHFAASKWLIQKPEYAYATGEDIKENGFYAPDSFSALTNVVGLAGDHDVFGDGSVIIKSMPGHTPGHQVLFIDLPEHGPTLLSGDMYHFQENRDGKIIPVFNHDLEQSKTAIADFEAFAKAKKATVYIQHEPADFAKMPVAPKALN
ncbi:N-acyl homoserine lactonase family protein [Dokdonia ponticola]|uniref:N-acyl homoserine lactonase family protein n=1 Tax=Dokdonia ponticola TaxID=2041041 RepID=A0ABV9I2C3_9FLAO